jgi:predicted patatin/cPLA2 family phospholipase
MTLSHPVLELLRERAASGSTPGERPDGQRVALVLEGGGMRGVVSAGMAAALERHGLTGGFDLIAGASAGAINGAALIAGVAEGCVTAYHTAFATREFINPLRLLRGRPALDVSFALGHASGELDAARHARTVDSAVELHCVAMDVDTAKTVDLTGMRSREALLEALLASSRLPWIGGDPVVIDGRRYVDGGLTEAIPVATAIAAGATHVLVLQTRPVGVPRSSGSKLADRLITRHLRRLNPDLVALYHRRAEVYEEVVAEIGRRSADPGAGPPHVLGLRPPAGTPAVSQLERRADVLATAAADAARLVDDLLEALPDPLARRDA